MMTSVTKTTSTQLVLKRSLDATSLEIAADGVSQEDSTLAGGSLSYALRGNCNHEPSLCRSLNGLREIQRPRFLSYNGNNIYGAA